MDDFSHLPKTRREARDSNSPLYFTGDPCKYGHIKPRYMTSGTCVACMKKISAEAYKRDPGKVRRSKENDPNFNAKAAARKRLRRKRDTQKARIADKRARQLNRVNVLQHARNWRQGNKDHVRNYTKRYDSTRRDLVERSARATRWAKENPEKHLANCHKRRTRKLGAEGSYTPGDIDLIFVRQQGFCAACKRSISKRYTIDHKMPLCRGGSNWPSNLQLLCKSCNSKKGKRTMEEWLAAMQV